MTADEVCPGVGVMIDAKKKLAQAEVGDTWVDEAACLLSPSEAGMLPCKTWRRRRWVIHGWMRQLVSCLPVRLACSLVKLARIAPCRAGRKASGWFGTWTSWCNLGDLQIGSPAFVGGE